MHTLRSLIKLSLRSPNSHVCALVIDLSCIGLWFCLVVDFDYWTRVSPKWHFCVGYSKPWTFPIACSASFRLLGCHIWVHWKLWGLLGEGNCCFDFITFRIFASCNHVNIKPLLPLTSILWDISFKGKRSWYWELVHLLTPCQVLR